MSTANSVFGFPADLGGREVLDHLGASIPGKPVDRGLLYITNKPNVGSPSYGSSALALRFGAPALRDVFHPPAARFDAVKDNTAAAKAMGTAAAKAGPAMP